MGRDLGALVIGDINLVRALGLAGVRVVLAATTRFTTAAFSRYCRRTVVVPPPARGEDFVDGLAAQMRALGGRFVIFPQGDDDTIALSAWRDRVGGHVLPLPAHDLVADTVDKLRFDGLAARTGLPVPVSRVLDASRDLAAQVADWSTWPCIVKPAMRTRWFGSTLATRQGESMKALRVESRAELDAVVVALRAHGGTFILQASVEGGEERVCSYHAYVRPDGDVVGEFTGEKVRTFSRRHGVSTCVRVTDDGEVAALGRDVLRRIGFSGVCKLDFKRDTRDGAIRLLEINPRFNLWHYPGAVAGVNLPGLVWQDAIAPGSARAGRARPGVVWVTVRQDWRAMREYRAAGELGVAAWLRSVAGAETWHEFAWHDPVPGMVTGVQLAAHAASSWGRRRS